jgi:hypothetical protein
MIFQLKHQDHIRSFPLKRRPNRQPRIFPLPGSFRGIHNLNDRNNNILMLWLRLIIKKVKHALICIEGHINYWRVGWLLWLGEQVCVVLH